MLDLPKVKHQRRQLGIPNPRHFVPLCQRIEYQWAELQKHFATSRLSLSTPIPGPDRAARTEYYLRDVPYQRVLRSTGARVVLKTDIMRYYGSIYTHSIPWALHTKAVAKRERGPTLFGNVLDQACRSLQDGQTIGVPIGPDTSLILAEVVGTALDAYLQDVDPSLQGCRYIDDYYLYFPSVATAEKVYEALVRVANEYQLETNAGKTTIATLPEPLEAAWVFDLQHHYLSKSFPTQRGNILTYFSKAFQFSKEYPDQSVLQYALRRTTSYFVHPENWGLYESLVLRAMIDEPSVLPIACEILESYRAAEYPVDVEKIGETLSELIDHHSGLGHVFEVVWALWIGRQLHIQLKAETLARLNDTSNALVCILALDLMERGTGAGLNANHWKTLISKAELFGPQWLLVYEAQAKGWLVDSKDGPFGGDPFFTSLNELNVEFYHQAATGRVFVPREEGQSEHSAPGGESTHEEFVSH